MPHFFSFLFLSRPLTLPIFLPKVRNGGAKICSATRAAEVSSSRMLPCDPQKCVPLPRKKYYPVLQNYLVRESRPTSCKNVSCEPHTDTAVAELKHRLGINLSPKNYATQSMCLPSSCLPQLLKRSIIMRAYYTHLAAAARVIERKSPNAL